MIGYPISRKELLRSIDAFRPGWLDRAAERTKALVESGEYSKQSPIWGEIKSVYMKLQHEKCAFCERRLASADHGGAIEHDVEHFRPKSRVAAWPAPIGLLRAEAGHPFATGSPSTTGYYWLAYHPENYCVACKKCNSPLKGDIFPIAATARGMAPANPRKLTAAEWPYLLYPIGCVDDNPEAVIGFVGINAVVLGKRGHKARRARVAIELLALNDREELLRERADRLVSLSNALTLIEVLDEADPRRIQAQNDIERMCCPSEPHTSCVRSACRAYQRDRDLMLRLFDAARKYLEHTHS